MMYCMKNHKRTDQIPCGLTGQISFERLEKLFHETGELRPDERVSHFHVTYDGKIRFVIDT